MEVEGRGGVLEIAIKLSEAKENQPNKMYPKIMRGKTRKRRPDHNDDDDVSLEEDDDSAFPNRSESTANGMFS